MRGISGENSPSTRWTRSSHRAPTGSRPPISPLTGLCTSKSFSWTFAIDVDTALGAVAQFETFDEKLTQADTFIRGALGLMSHQSARCVFDILLDYSRLSDACDTVNHQADKLKEALSTYGAVMNNVRNKYKDLIAFAQTAGLSVVGDYTNCTVTRLFAFWGVGVVFEASRGSWTVSWDDDRTQELASGASSTKTRTQFGYPNFVQHPKTLQFQRCDFNV